MFSDEKSVSTVLSNNTQMQSRNNEISAFQSYYIGDRGKRHYGEDLRRGCDGRHHKPSLKKENFTEYILNPATQHLM